MVLAQLIHTLSERQGGIDSFGVALTPSGIGSSVAMRKKATQSDGDATSKMTHSQAISHWGSQDLSACVRLFRLQGQLAKLSRCSYRGFATDAQTTRKPVLPRRLPGVKELRSADRANEGK